MSIFGFGKKKSESKVASCGCGGVCTAQQEIKPDQIKADINSIGMLGTGCPSCHALFENAKKAAGSLGLNTEVEYITDLQKIMEYGVMSVPALMINDKVVSTGKVLKAAEIEKLLG